MADSGRRCEGEHFNFEDRATKQRVPKKKFTKNVCPGLIKCGTPPKGTAVLELANIVTFLWRHCFLLDPESKISAEFDVAHYNATETELINAIAIVRDDFQRSLYQILLRFLRKELNEAWATIEAMHMLTGEQEAVVYAVRVYAGFEPVSEAEMRAVRDRVMAEAGREAETQAFAIMLEAVIARYIYEGDADRSLSYIDQLLILILPGEPTFHVRIRIVKIICHVYQRTYAEQSRTNLCHEKLIYEERAMEITADIEKVSKRIDDLTKQLRVAVDAVNNYIRAGLLPDIFAEIWASVQEYLYHSFTPDEDENSLKALWEPLQPKSEENWASSFAEAYCFDIAGIVN